MPRFKVDATPEGAIPADQAAGLLAMHCLTRGQAPGNFMVMVPIGDTLLSEVTSRAEKLLEAGRAIAFPVRLSRREQEVLTGVLQSLQNKEIAGRLCISERTVKFYVSSLLAKFQVRNRVALMEAVNVLLPEDPLGAAPVAESQRAEGKARSSEPQRRGGERRSSTEDRFLSLAKSWVPA